MANGYCWCPFFYVDCSRRLWTPNILSHSKRKSTQPKVERSGTLGCFCK